MERAPDKYLEFEIEKTFAGFVYKEAPEQDIECEA